MSLLFSTGVIAASGLAKGAPGMVLLTPTSITHSGTSASIGANGQVTFTAVTSLSLNGVFSADFDNYVVSISSAVTTNSPAILARLRASGSDATAGNYAWQFLLASSTTISAARGTSQTFFYASFPDDDLAANGATMSLYGPFLAQPTAGRTVDQDSTSSARLSDMVGTHSLSTSYDGITLYPGAGSMTGKLAVYGIRS